MNTCIRIAVPMLGLAAATLNAQCTDGSPPPCPTGRAGRPAVKVVRPAGREARVTVTYAATPMSYVLADFEQAGQLSIVRTLAVDTQSISVRFQDQRWDSAFASVIQAKGLVSFHLPSGARVVRTGKEDQFLLQAEPVEAFSVTLSSARAWDVASFLKHVFSTRGGYSVDSAANTITVSEAASRVRRLRILVDSLDGRPPKEP